MSSRIFETARTLIYDPVAANRNATRAALQSIGFRNVDPAAGLDILEDRLRERSPAAIPAPEAYAHRVMAATIRVVAFLASHPAKPNARPCGT